MRAATATTATRLPDAMELTGLLDVAGERESGPAVAGAIAVICSLSLFWLVAGIAVGVLVGTSWL